MLPFSFPGWKLLYYRGQLAGRWQLEKHLVNAILRQIFERRVRTRACMRAHHMPRV